MKSARPTVILLFLFVLGVGVIAGGAAYMIFSPPPLPNPAPNGWDRNDQGTGVPVPPAVVERLDEHDETRGRIDQLDPDFQGKLGELLDRLRAEGWAARVAIGPRSVEVQRRTFAKGRSRILRGSHLCGKAADLSLYPVGMPAVDHPFWSAKDRIALELGLDIVDYPPDAEGFIDRPHVQLEPCTPRDWDRVGLSVVGQWSGDDHALELRREADGIVGVWTEDAPVDVHDAQVSVATTGAEREKVTATVVLNLADARRLEGRVSSVRSETGHERPSYEWLEFETAKGPVRLLRD